MVENRRWPTGRDDQLSGTATSATLASATSRQVSVLVVEDNEINQALMLAMLAPLQHVVDIAADGHEAIAAARCVAYDIVLMDINMPKMDGVEATRIIRSLSGAYAAIPIIAVTANAMVGDREQYLAAGLSDYLSKPIDRTQLIETIKKWTGDPSLGIVEGT